ncbi:GDP-mannose mannosyl hydrolase [Shewanella sp. KCT]|uniref:GDP-mannose mannosyl hydrolase n=1 Tax=Shewanella sp. KCT TaxID=2569535 RepID=UPI0011836667|nr:GDP-mannose mannosyl hydrolase [Shewanella sp. KCT]TVP10598.1 GDP-mannose mannosyl hydrolase [Shewanella sp. KCT]
MFLDQDTFTTVIASTPLVSIDLVVINTKGKALLGRRLNRPAKDYWFVPGGRILKNETIVDAFKRLTQDELGQAFTMEHASLLGPFDHFYDDYVFGDEVTTHYVAIAFILKLECELENLPLDEQHGGYRWFDIPQLMTNDKVHKHSKWYFDNHTTDLL